MFSRLRKFSRRQDGAATLEFVVVFIGFISMMFFVMEVALYNFFVATMEKAAEAGARAVATSPFLIPTIPQTIEPDDGDFGDSCSQSNDTCVPFTSNPNGLSCTGEGCGAGFDRILNHMRGFNSLITANNVTVRYSEVGIGFAGGPTTPMVTVTVQGVPFQAGILGLLLSDEGNAGTLAGLTTLPTRSASVMGEK